MPGPVGKQQPVKGRRSSLCNVVDVTAVITSWGVVGNPGIPVPLHRSTNLFALFHHI